MTTQIAKWGNSLGVRLPRAVARAARLDEGDTVEVSVSDGTIVIRSGRRTQSLDELVSKIPRQNRYGAGEWGPPAGREVW
jgi:antitoxin MazE